MAKRKRRRSRNDSETIDPQPRVGQASYQAIGVSDRVGVVNHAMRTNPGKGTPSGPGDSRVTHHAADDANHAAASPRPASTRLTGGSLGTSCSSPTELPVVCARMLH